MSRVPPIREMSQQNSYAVRTGSPCFSGRPPRRPGCRPVLPGPPRGAANSPFPPQSPAGVWLPPSLIGFQGHCEVPLCPPDSPLCSWSCSGRHLHTHPDRQGPHTAPCSAGPQAGGRQSRAAAHGLPPPRPPTPAPRTPPAPPSIHTRPPCPQALTAQSPPRTAPAASTPHTPHGDSGSHWGAPSITCLTLGSGSGHGLRL